MTEWKRRKQSFLASLQLTIQLPLASFLRCLISLCQGVTLWSIVNPFNSFVCRFGVNQSAHQFRDQLNPFLDPKSLPYTHTHTHLRAHTLFHVKDGASLEWVRRWQQNRFKWAATTVNTTASITNGNPFSLLCVYFLCLFPTFGVYVCV